MSPATLLHGTPELRLGAKTIERLASGISELDALLEGGIARGSLAEIVGPECSGRTTFAYSLLASATERQEICAYIDTFDSFDPQSAAAAGILLPQLVWIRCGKNAEHALKAADLLLHAGGFGVVALDLCEITARSANRIAVSTWWRFRRAVENTPTILAVLEKQPLAKSCAGTLLEMRRKKTGWVGARGFELMRNVELEATPRKPLRNTGARFQAQALA